MKTHSQLSIYKRITRSMNKHKSNKSNNNKKKLKLNEKDSTSRHNQRSLEDFPDAILCHILSFFPTELAVRISVLSKRWRFLWTSLPNLDFQQRTHLLHNPRKTLRRSERRTFIDFVERVLCYHNAPRIKRFALSYNVSKKDDVSHIKKWISIAVHRNAQEFDITLGDDYSMSCNPLEFPQCLLNSEILEVLKIQTYCELQLPPAVHLPNLKKLYLRCYTFRDYHEVHLLIASTRTLEELVMDETQRYKIPESEFIIPAHKLVQNLKMLILRNIYLNDYNALNLLFASSALEDLVLVNCTWEGDALAGHIIISAPNLRSLIMDETRIRSHDGLASVTISAPLRSFYYSGAFIKHYGLSCSSSIEMATIYFNNYNIDMEEIDLDQIDLLDRLHNILGRSLQYVKYLELSTYTILELDGERLPTFNNLTSLEIFDDSDEDHLYGGLRKILNKCPYLETLKLPGAILAVCDDSTRLLISGKLKCLSSLKNIKIGCFKGSTEELIAVHILLAKATSLETMEIGWLWKKRDAPERKKIETFLSDIRRVSIACELNIGLCQNLKSSTSINRSCLCH